MSAPLLLLFCCALLLVTVMVSGAPQEVVLKPYATRYDHLDVDTILNNRRMVNYYAACLLSHGPCPPQGVELKNILPEAIQTNCARCTEKQKAVTLRSIKRLRKEYPKIWEQLVQLWDPDDVYLRRFEAIFDSYGNPITTTTEKATTIILLGDRFDEGEEEQQPPQENNSGPYPSLSIDSNPSFSSTLASTTSSSTTTNKPKTTNRTRIPPRRNNLQATVAFVNAIQRLVVQIHEQKLEILKRVLYGW